MHGQFWGVRLSYRLNTCNLASYFQSTSQGDLYLLVFLLFPCFQGKQKASCWFDKLNVFCWRFTFSWVIIMFSIFRFCISFICEVSVYLVAIFCILIEFLTVFMIFVISRMFPSSMSALFWCVPFYGDSAAFVFLCVLIIFLQRLHVLNQLRASHARAHSHFSLLYWLCENVSACVLYPAVNLTLSH